MKAIMIMYDSLNRHMLPPYGSKEILAPNFQRLADRTVTFDNCYLASAPCIPARRELHTGRYNFLHRSWGPIEPFDDSMPEILKNSGVYSHLITDHQHYWEDGGATYHNRYNSYEFVRGQESDLWKGHVTSSEGSDTRQLDANHHPRMQEQDKINRSYMPTAADQPQSKVFELGLEFIHQNHKEDNWFLQIESFDPHEPFFTHQAYKDLYPDTYDGPLFDWPPYEPVSEPPEQVRHARFQYMSLVSMCDEHLGKVLDAMDDLELWQDTMLLVCTDHGFLLGEHDWWAKIVQPFYNEVAHLPLFIWDPRSRRRGERSDCLVQMIDYAPTLLDFFSIPCPKDMQGKSLEKTISDDEPVREAALFGIHGGHVNCTDGRHVYMQAPATPENQPLFDYTLMPAHMRSLFTPDELRDISLAPPFTFTKNCQTLKVPTRAQLDPFPYGTLLFDLQSDPQQQKPLEDPDIKNSMQHKMVAMMRESDAPSEQFERLGIPAKRLY